MPIRSLLVLLLIANLGVLVWGLARDRPIDAPLPPPVRAPLTLRLLSETAPAEQTAAPEAPEATTPAPARDAPPRIDADPHAAPSTRPWPGTPGAATQPIRVPPAIPAPPAAAYDGGTQPPAQAPPLPRTYTERVDPGLLPDELYAEPPIVIPPVKEDDWQPTGWARELLGTGGD